MKVWSRQKNGLKVIFLSDIFLSIVPILYLISSQNLYALELDSGIVNFLETHCAECHDDVTTKGNFDVYALDPTFLSEAGLDQWGRVFDRISEGEMPPPKKKQPSSEEKRQFLEGVEPRIISGDKKRREVVQRRLNREEYNYTIRDLLHIDLDLRKYLPEDQLGGGFSNNGKALAFSPELLEGYLKVARLAVDAAIVTGEQPQVEKFTVDSLVEVERYLSQGLYSIDQGRVVIYLSGKEQYSKVSSRKQRPKLKGDYRITFEAATINTDEPIVFSITKSNFPSSGAVFEHVGYFEAEASPRTFSLSVPMKPREAIQFFAMGLPAWAKTPAQAKLAGVGFGPVTVEGPLYPQWPPPSHRELVGDVDLKSGTLQDAEKILTRLMSRAFRRSVSPLEVKAYLGLVKSRLDDGRGFEESLKVALTAVLASPSFLYIQEEARDGGLLSDLELASRLSYFIWKSQPDEQLLGSRLSNPTVAKRELHRLLQDPRRERFIQLFVSEWLELNKIEETSPDQKLYPEFDAVLQDSMLREGEAFFQELLDRNESIVNFLDSDFVMINRRLGEHYGIPGADHLTIERIPRPLHSVRGGVLTMAGVLKVTANGTNTSPVERGVWFLENILGKATPPPPSNIPGIEPDLRGAETIREKLAKHRELESCQVCHHMIDPPGFALESFDPVGAYREKYLQWVVSNAEKGWGSVQPMREVDASGQLKSGEAFSEIRSFKKLLLQEKDDFAKCLTGKLLSYATGREMGFSDRREIDRIVKAVAEEGYGLRSLLEEVVSSKIFRRQ